MLGEKVCIGRSCWRTEDVMVSGRLESMRRKARKLMVVWFVHMKVN